MSCNEQIRRNDIGTEFIVIITNCVDEVEVPRDISSALTKKIIIRKTDGETISANAVFTSVDSGGTGTGTDGKISYFSLVDDLSQLGIYEIQGLITTSNGSWSSEVGKFRVNKNIEAA